MRPTRSVLASCEPYPHSVQPCRPSPRVSITVRADVTASSFSGDEFFVMTAVLTSLRAETFRSGLRRPCGLECPQRVDALAGRRSLQAERPMRVEMPFGSRRFDDHSRRHRLDPAVARPRGSTMTTTAQNTTSSDQNSQAPITDEEVFAAHEGGKLSAELTSPLETPQELSIAYTPGVARVCTAIKDEPQLARTHTWTGRLVAVVSDGSAVLGLGDIGPAASLPVMEGKCALFKSFSGINAIPIVLD